MATTSPLPPWERTKSSNEEEEKVVTEGDPKDNAIDFLLRASEQGSLQTVEELLTGVEGGAAVVVDQDGDGNTPLMRASASGHLDVVATLLAHGANPNATNHDGSCSLLGAAHGNHQEVVETLLASGAQPNIATKTARTALFSASLSGNLSIVTAILSAMKKDVGVGLKIDVDQADNVGHTPLMAACHEGHTDVVRVLLDHGAAINATKRGGMTPLMMASMHGHTDVIKILVASGASLDKTDNYGEAALMFCYDDTTPPAAQVLLEVGANVNIVRGRTGGTALMQACENRERNLVAVLLHHGADATVADRCGRTAILFTKNDDVYIMKELLFMQFAKSLGALVL